MIFCFGEHELDEERFELRRGGTPVLVQPKVLELLLYLVRQSDRVVSKREILEAIWPDSVVTDGSIARAVSLARRAIGDRGGRSAVIATVARRGYRFEAPLRARAAPVVGDDSAQRYVGRAGLLARLSETLATALSGRGRILFLAGEAGIGKTRTAEVLAERARRAGAVVATAWGGEADAPAYWTWTRALRGLAELLPDVVARLSSAQRSALSPLMPELGGVRVAPRSTPGGEQSARTELFEAVQTLLGCCAVSRPLALFLDDLHVAGAESLALLEFLGQTLDTLPIAIVGTCREDEATRAPQPARALERLLRLRALERWPLAGLSGEEICDFVRAQHGAEPEPALIHALERQTGGNPLLLSESLRSLEARGLLGVTREAKAWEALLPRGIEHLLHPKLRRLSAGAADALRCAAAIGVEFERDLLARCLLDPSNLDVRLRELEDAALLFAAGSPALRLRFAHVLVRHALYEELVPAGASRRALHARIVGALPAEDSSPDAVAERAHHACEAAPLVAPALGAALARAAGDYAARLYDFERAAEWYGRAIATLELAPGSDRVLVAELLLSLGDAEVRAVGLDRARASYRVAAEHARSLGRGDLLARANLGLAQEPQGGSDGEPEWVEVLEEAERAVPTAERALHIRVQSRLGAELRHIDRTRGVVLVEAAIADARRLGDPWVLARTLEDGLYVRWTPEDPAPAIVLNREIVRAARAAGDLELALLAQRSCVASHLELGDIATVDREIRACEVTADVLRTPNARWQHVVLRAMRALVAGDLEAAERDVRLAIQVGERLDESYVSLQLPLQLAYLRLEQGRAAEIEPGAREQVRRFPRMSAWRAGLARLLVAAGRSAEAREELAPLSRARFADIPRDRGWLMTLALASEVAFATGDVRASELLEPLLAPCAHLSVVGGGGLVYYGSVLHHLGLLDLVRSRWDAAVARFEQALAAEARVGARLWEARTRIACARALLGRALPGDRALAVTLATAASELARTAGWAEVMADARAVESALWIQRRGSGPGHGRLLASES
jgi:DNA-binding winged helix-turn-helix (wHTH) protein/tetratricopeptide (TPR) repeat protein